MLKKRDVSSTELTPYFIQRIEKYDDALNAVVVRDLERAIDAAATPAFAHDHRPFDERTLTINGQERPFFESSFWAGLISRGGLPSTVFATGLSDSCLPIGLQAAGAEFDNYTTIEFARLMAQELGGFTAPPGLV